MGMGKFFRRRERKALKSILQGMSEMGVLLDDPARLKETQARYLYPQNKSTTPQQAMVNTLVLATMGGTATDLASDDDYRVPVTQLGSAEMKQAEVIAMRRCQEWAAELRRG